MRSFIFIPRRIAVAFFASILLSACAGEGIPFDSSTEMEKSFLEARSKIKPGKTNRYQVQEIFGTPYLVNNKSQLEVYRLTARDRVIMAASLIPLPAGTSSFMAILLVTYDRNEMVRDSDYFFISEPSIGRGKLRSYHSGGEATASGFVFSASWRDTEGFWTNYKYEDHLLAPYRIADQLFDTAESKKNCIISISTTGEEVKSIFIDSSLLKDPLRKLIHNGPPCNAINGRRGLPV